MKEIKLTEDMEGLLIEFDEYGFAPTITMPNAEEYAKAWKNTLIDLFKRLQYEKEELIKKNENLYGLNMNLIQDSAEQTDTICNMVKKMAKLQEENESLKKDYIELDLEARELRTESDRMVAEHLAFAELAKKADEVQKRYIEYLQRKLKQANITYRSKL